MFIQEICKACGLTKKAVEYYEKQGLIKPETGENGYRLFHEVDVRTLREIALLRKLGLSLADIRSIITHEDKASALRDCRAKMELNRRRMEVQYDGLNYLLDHHYDIEASTLFVDERLKDAGMIKDRLKEAFPGQYGVFLMLHFGRFLDEKIDTDEKMAAYQKIVSFLDSLEDMVFPEELAEQLTFFDALKDEDLEKMDEQLVASFEDYHSFMDENRETVLDYLNYRKSEDYKNSPANKLKQCLTDFMKKNGYYDIFIPNLMILSSSYRTYQSKLAKANEQFLKEFPELKDFQG